MTLYVLDKNVVPSVMLELGSILNTADRDFMTSATNMGIVADRILTALEAYAIQEQTTKPDVSISGQFHSFSDTDGIHHIRDFDITLDGLDAERSTTPLVLVAGKKMDPSLFEGKILKGDHLTAYAANDPKAIALYGPEAKHGVLIFENLTVEPKRKIRQE